MFQTTAIVKTKPTINEDINPFVSKKIHNLNDVNLFKTKSPGFVNTIKYIDLLCERIHSSGDKVFNSKYKLKHEVFIKCSDLLQALLKCCDETDLTRVTGSASLRFGHVAFRDWFDKMKIMCKNLIDSIASERDDQLKAELLVYLSESFGNKMRIDYGTGHELNFILFTIGLCKLIGVNNETSRAITKEELGAFVDSHGLDIHCLFAHHYLRLCRGLQTKFRLEPAGSRGVYNMDDFQFLPFLFGTAQLIGSKHIPISEFHQLEQVEQWKQDYIFFEAIDFIMKNKRGPFNEHSFTLWNFTGLGSWDNMHRRIRSKFNDDILGPFPIVQHLLFGKYILRWEKEETDTKRQKGDT